ncbi:MAG TPA: TonB-dependent receptor [Caulobacteraceae bacterium]
MYQATGKVRSRLGLKASVSAIALTTAVVLAPAMARAADDSSPDKATKVSEVVVTGVKKSLQTSQQIKIKSDTVVDSITEIDIGAFPDKSIADALQRVPGVTVNRFAASDDTSHFSAEPSGVLVRGLPQVRDEFNGRDTFSANSSRGLGWADVSPELMAGVDVYKNLTPDMIEGGLAGTVDLRTRLPFDSSGSVKALSVNANYGDLAKKFTPEASGMISQRWDTNIGEFGLMVNGAYSDVQTRSIGVQDGQNMTFLDMYGPGLKYIPASVADRDVAYERTRSGVSAAGQWQDHDHKFLLTVQYNDTSYEDTWKEQGIISYIGNPFGNDVRMIYQNTATGQPNQAPLPAPGTNFTFDKNGDFQSGVLTTLQCCAGPTAAGNSWWGAPPGDDTISGDAGNIALNSSGQNMLVPCYSWQGAACAFPGRGNDFEAVSRFNDTKTWTADGSVNLKWNPTDNWRFNFDLQHVQSAVNNYDIEVGQYSFANLGLNTTGERPVMTFLDPSNINQSPGGLANPDNYRYNHSMDHLEEDSGSEWASRVDGEYRFQSQWLDSLRFGIRYADREQQVDYSTYNWGNIANDWNLSNNQYVFWNIDNHTPNGSFTGYPTGLYSVQPFGNSFFGGKTQDYVFFNMAALEAHKADDLAFSKLGVGQDGWEPICMRSVDTVGCFAPDEITDVSEKTKAAYFELKFGGPDARLGTIGVSGNIGLRYVETDNESEGSVAGPPSFSPTDLACSAVPPPPPGAPPVLPKTLGCYISASEIAFNSGAFVKSDAKSVHRNWLPAFNVKLDVAPGWIVRFAASEGLSRPDIGLLKNYVQINRPVFPSTANAGDPAWVKDSSGNVIGVNPTYTANAYNPYLAPETADQFDFTVEHYFGSIGQFSIDLFSKQFHNYITYGTFNENVTLNGVTRTVQTTGPANAKGGALDGFEVDYQRFFDFLPGAWSGLGIQANYTYVNNESINNSNLKVSSGGTSAITAQPGTAATSLNVNALEGVSKNAYNLVGMYEHGPWALRLAYNWRSKWLVTRVDCCVYLPMWEMGAGFMDASIRYKVTPNMEISLQGTNLLNTETVVKQQVNDAGLLKPGSWFETDRRVTLGIRFKY